VDKVVLNLVSEDSQKLIPIDKIGKYLINFQNMVWHCGELLSDEPFRGRGRPNKRITSKCTLLMKNATISSFKPELVIGDNQTVLTGKTLGEDSIDLCSDLLNRTNSFEEFDSFIHSKVKNSLYRRRIIQDIDALIPSKNENIYLEFREGSKPQIKLNYEKKVFINKLLQKTSEEVAQFSGILSEIRVTQGPRKISLVGPEGKIPIEYPSDMEKELIEYLFQRAPVRISGMAVINSEGKIMKLQRITQIEPFKEVVRTRIISGDTEVNLKSPLIMKIGYEDDMWTMTNESLGIHAVSSAYQQCLDNAEEEFLFIIKEYLDTPDEELSRDAIDLKRKIKELLE
jgi:hypothetical protein